MPELLLDVQVLEIYLNEVSRGIHVVSDASSDLPETQFCV